MLAEDTRLLGQRQKTLYSEHNIHHDRQHICINSSCSLVPQGNVGGPPKMPAHTLSERNPDLREHESFMWSDKHAGPLLSSKVVHSTDVLEKKSGTKGNQHLCCKTCRNARDLGESSLKKELPHQWFCIQLLGCSHWKKNKIKQLWPNHNVVYEKLDKEGRICLMLGSPKSEFKMKIHMETLSQNNPVKEWGKQQWKGDSSQVLWQKAWS